MGTRRCVTSFPYLTVTKPDLSPSDISPCEAEKLRGPEARPYQKLHQGDIPQVAAPRDRAASPRFTVEGEARLTVRSWTL